MKTVTCTAILSLALLSGSQTLGQTQTPAFSNETVEIVDEPPLIIRTLTNFPNLYESLPHRWRSDPHGERESLTLGPDSRFFGTTFDGGKSGFGTVFRVNKDGTGFLVLHDFASSPGDGQNPVALIYGSDNKLYGVTSFGGTTNQTERGEVGFGTIFVLNRDGTDYKVLHSFAGPPGDGFDPEASIIEGAHGELYGTTFDGYGEISPNRPTEAGTVFQINKDGSHYLTLHRFGPFSDGLHPTGLVLRSGDLYGITVNGGTLASAGTLYKMSTNGITFSVLHQFGSGAENALPAQGLVLGSDGTLLGTLPRTVFTVDLADNYETHKLPESGLSPVLHGTLLLRSDGRVFGVDASGGDYGYGGVFTTKPDGSEYKSLFSVPTSDYWGSFPPFLSVIDGNLLYFIGSKNTPYNPEIYKLDGITGNFSALAAIASGAKPVGIPTGVTQSADGALYLNLYAGGSRSGGAILKTDAKGTDSVLLHQCSTGPADSAWPEGPLILTPGGTLYGLSFLGGTNNLGTVFKLNVDGSGFEVLHSFGGIGDGHPGPEFDLGGVWPQQSLVEGANGALYGITSRGGVLLQTPFEPRPFRAALFTLNKDGSGYTILHRFGLENEEGPDVPYPTTLFMGSDGLLYGAGSAVFRMRPDGSSLQIVRTNEVSLLIEARDGLLYGAGKSFFRMRPDGTAATNLFDLGALPFRPETMVEGPDGYFYLGGFNAQNNDFPAILRLNRDGSSSKLLRLTGGEPLRLTAGHDGSVYGTIALSGVLFAIPTLASGPIFLPPTIAGGAFAVRVRTTPNSTSRVERASLANGPWSLLFEKTADDAGYLDLLDSGNHSSTFYRILTFGFGSLR
jgi:uncharacterized repeat protein (TIGR03803 family)